MSTARAWTRLYAMNNIYIDPIIKSAWLLFCQDVFLFCLHLMDTVLETLQNKNPDIFNPLVIKCTLANLCLVLIHCCETSAEARSIIKTVDKLLQGPHSAFIYFLHHGLSIKHRKWRKLSGLAAGVWVFLLFFCVGR